MSRSIRRISFHTLKPSTRWFGWRCMQHAHRIKAHSAVARGCKCLIDVCLRIRKFASGQRMVQTLVGFIDSTPTAAATAHPRPFTHAFGTPMPPTMHSRSVSTTDNSSQPRRERLLHGQHALLRTHWRAANGLSGVAEGQGRRWVRQGSGVV
jgi:hypothetical protein